MWSARRAVPGRGLPKPGPTRQARWQAPTRSYAVDDSATLLQPTSESRIETTGPLRVPAMELVFVAAGRYFDGIYKIYGIGQIVQQGEVGFRLHLSGPSCSSCLGLGPRRSRVRRAGIRHEKPKQTKATKAGRPAGMPRTIRDQGSMGNRRVGTQRGMNSGSKQNNS